MCVNRWLMAAVVLWALEDEQRGKPTLIYPLRDLLGFVVWVASYMGDTMQYHGGAYSLGAGWTIPSRWSGSRRRAPQTCRAGNCQRLRRTVQVGEAPGRGSRQPRGSRYFGSQNEDRQVRATRKAFRALVGEDGFAAGSGQGVDGGEAAEFGDPLVGVISQQEEAAGAGPELVERGVGFEDGRGRRARSCRTRGRLSIR